MDVKGPSTFWCCGEPWAQFLCRRLFGCPRNEPGLAGQGGLGGASARGSAAARSTMEVIPECLSRS